MRLGVGGGGEEDGNQLQPAKGSGIDYLATLEKRVEEFQFSPEGKQSEEILLFSYLLTND